MKFVLIGNGWLPIPPYGWGAVETLIWDTANALRSAGHEVHIVNETKRTNAWERIEELQPDVVHLHNVYFLNPRHLSQYKVYLTCHYSYEGEERRLFREIMETPNSEKLTVIVLNEDVYNLHKSHGNIRIVPNGLDANPFLFSPMCAYPDRTISVASITELKRVPLLFPILSIDFVGLPLEQHIQITTPNYKGEWSRETLYSNLTNYANLILISQREAFGIVVVEAMFCGLGIVCSENVAKNFGTRAPWFTVLPEDRITDISFIESEIERNRKIAVQCRQEIRDYALTHFSIESHIQSLYFNQSNPETHA
jgi:glycosyltransferase involved in cell wall biosynthesis